MKRFKKFILSMLLNKRERIIIWNALWYSNHTYRRRGNINGAVAVSQVMNRVEYILGVVPQKYTKAEVDKIVDGVIDAIAKEVAEREVAIKRMVVGYDKGKEGGSHTGVLVIKAADCSECEETDCPIHKKMHDDSKLETEVPVEDSGEEKKEQEQAEESAEK